MLRSATLLAVLLAPLAASAQDVTFVDSGPFTVSECASSNPAMPVTWTVTTSAAIEAGSKYRILVLRTGESCATLTSPVDAQVIKKDLAAQFPSTGKTTPATYPGYDGTSADTLHLFDLVQAAGATCEGTANLTVTVCVQLTKADLTYVTSATGTFSIEREPPAQPLTVTVTGGDHALLVGWKSGTGSNTDTSTYVVEAYQCASATDTVCASTAAGAVETGNDTTVSARIDGLTVGTRYKVLVYALSVNGTRSVASEPQFGIPIEAFDFWEQYWKTTEEGEQGGCAGGPGGLLSLLGVAGLLRAVRRRS